jgi:hypothetical protein
MKKLGCALAAAVVLALGSPAAAQIFANPPAPSGPEPSWREQRALRDWRNNTWRERQFDQDWRNNTWRRERANQDWRSREEFLRERMPNSATDFGAVIPPAEEGADKTAKKKEEECSTLPPGVTGPCPDVPAATTEQPDGKNGKPESPSGG